MYFKIQSDQPRITPNALKSQSFDLLTKSYINLQIIYNSKIEKCLEAVIDYQLNVDVYVTPACGKPNQKLGVLAHVYSFRIKKRGDK